MADEIQINEKDLMGRLMADLKRAGELGLIPQEGAKISQRGEFIVDESNIEEDENKKMRGYRHKEYGSHGKTLHGWDDEKDEPVTLSVKNPQEEAKALELGWSLTPLYGPAGRLDATGAPVAEEVVKEVREFAPPGQKQPFDAPAKQPESDEPKRGRRKK